MAKIAGTKVAKVARGAGFRGNLLVTMVAIARAESAWDPKAHNGVSPDNSYGLWQINMLGALGKERRKLLGLHDNDQLFDPATNARAARVIYKQQGKEAWATYIHGSYKAHLVKAQEAVDPLKDGGGDPAEPKTPSKAGIYVAKQGDNLTLIARRVLGAAYLWLPLYEVNQAVIGPDPNNLKVGTTLRLPVIYTIRDGDSLTKIAKRLLSKASAWHQIYQLNKAAIGPDPNKLKAGAKIALP